MLLSAENRFGRVGARVHPVDHPAFADDVATLVGQRGAAGCAYLMLPKVREPGRRRAGRRARSIAAAGARLRGASRCTR